ncbi:hypothetical protein TNCV_3270321 [Trichonephila clavipes]|uniref:Transposase n=1 Tax=Trichonephila clavipes TaxID=2585209 RepID=A0A8X6S5S4_TRICX|nr:hypothetical protein TNCV_3270321 [Trichonephila clavipes]
MFVFYTLTRGIRLIASRPEIPCSVLVETTDGDSSQLGITIPVYLDTEYRYFEPFVQFLNTEPSSVAILDRFNSCQVIYSQFGLAIHQNDHQARRRFDEWAQNEMAVVPDFHKRILFSDEAHFWLKCYVNKQNCRIWSEANPQVYVETPLHPEKLTVWCVL